MPSHRAHPVGSRQRIEALKEIGIVQGNAFGRRCFSGADCSSPDAGNAQPADETCGNLEELVSIHVELALFIEFE